MAAKFDYIGTRADADALIQEFGMAAVLRRDSSPTDRDCVVVIVEYQPRDRASSLANPTDRVVLMSAATLDIQDLPPDSELDQLVTFKQPVPNLGPPVEDEVLPMTCKPKLYSFAGIPVLYEFTVRR